MFIEWGSYCIIRAVWILHPSPFSVLCVREMAISAVLGGAISHLKGPKAVSRGRENVPTFLWLGWRQVQLGPGPLPFVSEGKAFILEAEEPSGFHRAA